MFVVIDDIPGLESRLKCASLRACVYHTSAGRDNKRLATTRVGAMENSPVWEFGSRSKFFERKITLV